MVNRAYSMPIWGATCSNDRGNKRTHERSDGWREDAVDLQHTLSVISLSCRHTQAQTGRHYGDIVSAPWLEQVSSIVRMSDQRGSGYTVGHGRL